MRTTGAEYFITVTTEGQVTTVVTLLHCAMRHNDPVSPKLNVSVLFPTKTLRCNEVTPVALCCIDCDRTSKAGATLIGTV